MQRKHRAEMGPTRYKPDDNDHREDHVRDKATRLPKSDGVGEEPSKRAGWRFAKTLRMSGNCGLHREVSGHLSKADGTKIHDRFLLSSTLQHEVASFAPTARPLESPSLHRLKPVPLGIVTRAQRERAAQGKSCGNTFGYTESGQPVDNVI